MPGTFGYEGNGRPQRSDVWSQETTAARYSASTRPPTAGQTMYQTFNENSSYLQSELLRHGELDWLARDTYFGDQRNYLETHIDDNFLSDDSYTPGTGVGGWCHGLQRGRRGSASSRPTSRRQWLGRRPTTSASTCSTTVEAAPGIRLPIRCWQHSRPTRALSDGLTTRGITRISIRDAQVRLSFRARSPRTPPLQPAL